MGIYDRDYVRMGPRSRSGLGSLHFISLNSWIIILNVAVFLIDPLLANYRRPVIISQRIEHVVPVQDRVVVIPNPMPPPSAVFRAPVVDAKSQQAIGEAIVSVMTPLQAYGHFSTSHVLNLEVWRFITFQFLHANLMHLVLNMFGLWVFGGMVEQFLGRKRYGAFYLMSGIAGAISYLILNLLGAGLGLRLPGVLVDSPDTPLVGASAGVFGVIMACAFIAPQAVVLVYFFPLKLRVMAYGYVALAAFNLLRGSANAGGEAAHLGGAIAGFFFIRNSHLLRDFFDVFSDSRKRVPRPQPGPPAHDDAETDRILAKVRDQGLSSLSAAEKSSLRRATMRRNAG